MAMAKRMGAGCENPRPVGMAYGMVKKGQNSLSREIWVKEVSLRRLKYFACNCGLKIRMLTIWRVHMIHITKKLHKNIRIWC